MKRFFSVMAVGLICVSLSVSCAKKGASADQFIGKWSVDAEAMMNLPEVKQQIPNDDAKKMFTELLGAMKFEFTKDEFIAEMQGQKNVTKYVVASSSGSTFVLEATDGPSKGTKISITVKDADTIAMANEADAKAGGPKEFLLKRVK